MIHKESHQRSLGIPEFFDFPMSHAFPICSQPSTTFIVSSSESYRNTYEHKKSDICIQVYTHVRLQVVKGQMTEYLNFNLSAIPYILKLALPLTSPL